MQCWNTTCRPTPAANFEYRRPPARGSSAAEAEHEWWTILPLANCSPREWSQPDLAPRCVWHEESRIATPQCSRKGSPAGPDARARRTRELQVERQSPCQFLRKSSQPAGSPSAVPSGKKNLFQRVPLHLRSGIARDHHVSVHSSADDPGIFSIPAKYFCDGA
jgi:hypothetical protein